MNNRLAGLVENCLTVSAFKRDLEIDQTANQHAHNAVAQNYGANVFRHTVNNPNDGARKNNQDHGQA